MTNPTIPAAINQIISVRIVSRRTSRRSCSRIFQVICWLSGTPARSRASTFKSAFPTSLSLIFGRPFEDGSESSLGIVQPRTDRADRATQATGYVFVSHLFEKPKHEDLAVIGRDLVERCVYWGRILGREFRNVVGRDRFVSGERFGNPTPTQQPGRTVVCHPV